MRYAVLLAVAVGMAAGQSIEWRAQQCGWWWGRDAAGHQIGIIHKVGGCPWIDPEPTRYYLAWGLGDDATAQLGPQDLEDARPAIKMCSGITGECEVPATEGIFTKKELQDQLATARLTDSVPEPLDVPAIHHESIPVDHPRECPSDAMIGSNAAQNKYLCQPAKEWTCKDTTNALLTAEVGTKWCHKIQK